MTVFAPNDEAFKAADGPDLSKLTNAEVVSLLQYRALAAYSLVETLKHTKGRISTLATNGAGKYDLDVKTAGDSVSLVTEVDDSRIASTVIDSTPLCIVTVDSFALPRRALRESSFSDAWTGAGDISLSFSGRGSYPCVCSEACRRAVALLITVNENLLK